jgi:hypothetical protein
MKYSIHILLFLVVAAGTKAEEVYLTPADFVEQSFSGAEPEPDRKAMWIAGDLKERAHDVLEHPYSGLRVRYWERGERTAWILDEIGKYDPITLGVVVDGGRIESVEVLIYRESRGWEIHLPVFREQFRGATLDPQLALDRNIDGISGATLSVRAVKRMARLALVLDREVEHQDGANQPAQP